MTPRYLILARGDQAQRRAIAERVTGPTGLTIVAELPTALVVADRATKYGLPLKPLVLGDMFARQTGERIDERERGGCLTSPDTMLRTAWGRYLAIFDDGAAGLRIVRDPSGAVACYYRLTTDMIAIASDLQLLDLAMPARAGLDWSEIGRLLVEVDLRSPRTGLANTTELLPGTLLTIGPADHTLSSCWSPWDHARPSRDQDFGRAAATLRERIATVTAALAAAHEGAIATVSGGLDSSIVALTLAGHVDLGCLTLATEDPSGDERRYARLVAAATGSRYLEHILDPAAIDLQRSQAAHLPRPVGRPFLVPMIAAFTEAIRLCDATTVFNGIGGDNVFCFLQSATPAADRLTRGDLIGAAVTVGDIARMTGASYPTVATAALRRAAQGNKPRPWRRDCRFVRPELAREIADYAHPWLQPSAGGRVGTGAHVTMLLRAQNYIDPWTPDFPADVINPLLAQPVVEHCLGIPSWEWCRGGRDRSVARAAFADRLPPAIVQRSWKGGPDGFIAAIVDRRRETIQQLLAEGMLAEQGLVDRGAVRGALEDRRPLAAGNALRLLSLADTEAWVRTHG